MPGERQPVPDVTPHASTPQPADVGNLLDDPAAWSAFSRPVQERAACWESHLVIEGMHCAACALTVEEALRVVPGVSAASVSAGSRRARVRWQADVVQPSGWMEAVRRAGYRAVPANDAFASERRRQETRRLFDHAVRGLRLSAERRAYQKCRNNPLVHLVHSHSP